MLKVWMQICREKEPLCLERTPEFMWYLESERRGCRQAVYRLTVCMADGTQLWDSGLQNTDAAQATYAGPAIPPETTCTAVLTVTDCFGETAETQMRFRTGLMAEKFEDPQWGGAKWIGTDTMPLWAPALEVFQLSCEIMLEEGCYSAGILFGGDDPRLTDGNKNILGVEALPMESYVYVRLNTRPLRELEAAALEVYRVGYTREDRKDVPMFSLPVPAEVLNRENQYASHLLHIKAVYGQIDVYLDGVKINVPQGEVSPWNTGALNLNPMGRGGDFICFPALNLIGVQADPAQNVTFRNLTVKNYRTPENVLFRAMEEGEYFQGGVHGQKFLLDPSKGGLPLVRREFLTGKVERAYLTITARGIYEAYLNGEKIGNDFLTPGLTQYNKTHMYQVYDVTSLLRHGENALGIMLGEGWWSGAITFSGENWNFFGDRQSVIAKLTLEKADGSIQTIVTDDSFTASNQGPNRYASLFQGQVYDAVYEEEVVGWTRPGFRGAWPQASVIELSPENAAIGDLPGMMGRTEKMDYSGQRCMGQIGNNVKCVKMLSAQSVQEVRPGVFVYDFGQNIAGIPEILLPAGPGGTVSLRYAEILYPDLPEYADRKGMLMTENLRGALVTDTVMLGEEPVLFRPQFTFHGFRYMELTGLETPVPPEDVKALALSSVENLNADFRCSEDKVNRLFENICWSLRDNFLSIPTDCPQRNERMGWSGDLSVFSRTAVYLCDADAFLRRHMMALRDMQHEDGRFPDIAPVTDGFGGILWGSVGMTAPWEAYLQYGDKTILEEHYDAMARYINFLNQNIDDKTGLQTAGELGDWLGPQNGKTENALLWMTYYVYDLEIMAKTAELLEKPEASAYEALWRLARQRLGDVYFDPETHRTVYSSEDAARGNRMVFEPIDRTKPLPPKEPCGGYRMDTQTSYCVPLMLDAVPEEHIDEARVHLAHVCQEESVDDGGVTRPPYSLMTGFIGTAWILPALTQAGRDDVAYRMLMHTGYPSWLYPVEQGATTIWERLDSYTVEGGFGGHNSMNSFNHYSFGAVGAWMLSRCLGIDRENPGFRQFVLRPMPDEDREMTWAEGFCMTPAGRIESRWEATDRGIRYRFTVPANASCVLQLPGNPFARITESGKAPSEAEGVTDLGHNGRYHQFWLDAGAYEFEVAR